MKVRTQTFWLPKRGNSTEEYEDSAWPMDDTESDGIDEYKCAVADGATEASFSNRWAQLLVRGFAEDIELEESAANWSLDIEKLELPWYAQEKAEAGAFATLAGLHLKSAGSEGGTWSSKTLGDSCILHVRGGNLLKALPLSDSESFNNSPVLLCSNLKSHENIESLFATHDGVWQKDDQFLLLTDALAHWTFKQQERNGDGIKSICEITSQEQLTSLVEREREKVDEDGRPSMRNDDVTLLRVEL